MICYKKVRVLTSYTIYLMLSDKQQVSESRDEALPFNGIWNVMNFLKIIIKPKNMKSFIKTMFSTKQNNNKFFKTKEFYYIGIRSCRKINLIEGYLFLLARKISLVCLWAGCKLMAKLNFIDIMNFLIKFPVA